VGQCGDAPAGAPVAVDRDAGRLSEARGVLGQCVARTPRSQVSTAVGPTGMYPNGYRGRTPGRLLVAEGVDRIEPGGLAGGIEAEEDPDGPREDEGEPD